MWGGHFGKNMEPPCRFNSARRPTLRLNHIGYIRRHDIRAMAFGADPFGPLEKAINVSYNLFPGIQIHFPDIFCANTAPAFTYTR